MTSGCENTNGSQVPSDNVTACIKICTSLYYTSGCKAAAWNGPLKQCFLKSGKANPRHSPGDISFLLGTSVSSPRKGEAQGGVVHLKTEDGAANIGDRVRGRVFDDWHYPAEEGAESAALAAVGASEIDANSGVATLFSGGNSNETRCRAGDTVFRGEWHVLEVMQADDGADMVVLEHRAARWGVLIYVTLDGCVPIAPAGRLCTRAL